MPTWSSKWPIVAALAVAIEADIAEDIVAATGAQPCIGAAFTGAGWPTAADMAVIAIPTIKTVVVGIMAAGESIVAVRSTAAARFIVVAIAGTLARAIAAARMLPTGAEVAAGI